MRLLYLVHADASVLPLYKAALPADVDIVPFVGPPLPNVKGGGMSSRYQALGQQLRAAHGSVLKGLAHKYPPPATLEEYSDIFVATWSAGYALARTFTDEDRRRTAGLVLLDSGHADEDPDGTARDTGPTGVAWAVSWAKEARACDRVFWIGHSDVKTYGTVASTTQFADEVVRHADGTGGLFHVEAFDVSKSDHDEHIAALRGWGAGFVAEAMAVGGAPPTDRTPTRVATPVGTRLDFGEAVLTIAKEDLNLAPREERRNGGEFIERMYLQPLGLSAGDSYCAAAVTSWIKRAEQRTGMKAPIIGSGGAQMLMQQLKAAGRWVPRAKLTPAMIRPGMLLVWDREDPKVKGDEWKGHVACAIEGVGGHSAGCIEGNADKLVEPITKQLYAVIQTERRLDDARLFGAGYLGEVPALLVG